VVEELRQAAKPGRADDAIARLRRATELLGRGDAKGAGLEAKKARDDAPRSVTAREIYGLALYGLARYPEALAEMQAYRRMSGRADQNHIIADCLRATGRPERSIPLAEEALRSNASDEAKAEAVIVAAAAMADLGRFDEALAMISRARTDENVGRDYVLRLWYVRGDVLARAGRRPEAAAEFRKIVRHDAGAFDAAERLASLG
jgi:tetratricopeptide (TPR) repeat protein